MLYKSHLFQLFFEDGQHLETIDVNSIERTTILMEKQMSIASAGANKLNQSFDSDTNENGREISSEQPIKPVASGSAEISQGKHTAIWHRQLG